MKSRHGVTYKGDGPEYFYSTARIRALEARMLTPAGLERMAEAPDPAEALKVLGEFAGYQAAVSALKEPADFAFALEQELAGCCRLAAHLSGAHPLVGLFFLAGDFHNLKVLLKKESAEKKTIEAEEASELSTWKEPARLGAKELVPALAKNDWTAFFPENLPPRFSSRRREEIRAEMHAEIAGFRESGDGRRLEFGLDRSRLRLRREVTGSAGSAYMLDYVRREIDLYNLTAFFRLRRFQLPAEQMETVFLAGGNVDAGFYPALAGEADAGLTPKNVPAEYQESMREGMGFLRGGPAAPMEQAAERCLRVYAHRARYRGSGIEPLLAFLLAKEHEARQVRRVMTGKLNGIPATEIRSWLAE